MKYTPRVGDNIEFQYNTSKWYKGTIIYIRNSNICAKLPCAYDDEVRGWPAYEFAMEKEPNVSPRDLCWWIGGKPMRLAKPTSYKELFLRKLMP